MRPSEYTSLTVHNYFNILCALPADDDSLVVAIQGFVRAFMSRKAQSVVVPSNGIKGAMKQRILLDMIESVAGSFKILLVDKTSAEILSVCLRMNELMDHGITLVEDIKNTRQPITKSPAIYFVAPSEASVKLIIDDWATKDKYLEAHIFFTSSAPQRIIDMIASARILDKVKSMKDMLLDFSVPETLSFHFGIVDSMVNLLGPSISQPTLQSAVAKLTSVAHTLGDNPIIRFQNNGLCRTFAEQFSASVNALAAEIPALGKQEPRTIVVIVDRSIDPAAALLHERTYEGMINDLMPLENMMYQQAYKDRSGKDAVRSCLLDELDQYWCKFRHMFLPNAVEQLPAALKQLLADNPELAGGLEKGSKLNAVAKAIRSLPEFQEKQARLSMHIDILSKVMDLYKAQSLTEVSALEQKIAGGGAFKDTYDAVKKVMKNADDTVKLRVMLLFCACCTSRDFTAAKKQALLQDLGLESDSMSISNLDAVVSRTGVIPQPKTSAADRDPFVPQVKLILEALCAETLSTTDFPFIRPGDASLTTTAAAAPAKRSLRSGGSRPGAARGGEHVLDLGHEEKIFLSNQQRLLVFVLGGVTRADVRSAYDIAREKQREAIVGGTSLLRAETFIRQLPGMK